MTTKELANPAPMQEMYERFFGDLARNDLKPGTRLQPIRKLAKVYNVSYLTAQRVVRRLQEEGVVESRPGDGVYLRGKISPPEGAPQSSGVVPAGGLSHDGLKGHKAGRRVYSIGIVMPYWVSMRGGMAVHAIIKGILGRADSHNWRVELIHNSRQEACEPGFVDKVLEKDVQGVIWLQPVPEHKMNLMRLIDRGIEVVATGRRFPTLPLKVVREDQQDMAEKIVRYCLERQRRHLVMLTGSITGRTADAYSADIVAEMRRVLSEQGLELPDEAICPCHNVPMWREVIEVFFEKQRHADAIICLHDNILPGIEELDRRDFWSDPASLVFIDVPAEYANVLQDVGRIRIAKVVHPFEGIGEAALQVFEEAWLASAGGPTPDLTVEVR